MTENHENESVNLGNNLGSYCSTSTLGNHIGRLMQVMAVLKVPVYTALAICEIQAYIISAALSCNLILQNFTIAKMMDSLSV